MQMSTNGRNWIGPYPVRHEPFLIPTTILSGQPRTKHPEPRNAKPN
jgi:hypothetical protein